MTQDSPELPEETGEALGRLGRVAPPDAGVLDAAREILWAAVAAEMLPDEAAGAVEMLHDEAAGAVDQVSEAGRPGGSRRVAERETDRVAERETDQPGQAGRLRPGDPGT